MNPSAESTSPPVDDNYTIETRRTLDRLRALRDAAFTPAERAELQDQINEISLNWFITTTLFDDDLELLDLVPLR